MITSAVQDSSLFLLKYIDDASGGLVQGPVLPLELAGDRRLGLLHSTAV